jgi:hypothetical protein
MFAVVYAMRENLLLIILTIICGRMHFLRNIEKLQRDISGTSLAISTGYQRMN